MQVRLLLAAGTIALAGCQNAAATDARAQHSGLAQAAAHQHDALSHRDATLTAADLARVRRATARYTDVRNAQADGYHDIDVVIPNMGRHFLRDTLVDAKFEAERPELLVYSSDTRGRMKLVSVEYAIPLDLSAEAPEGFTGDADVWFADQRFKLWTLHAWVWRENPQGMFNPTNIRVP